MWGLRLAHSSHRSARRVRAFCFQIVCSAAHPLQPCGLCNGLQRLPFGVGRAGAPLLDSSQFQSSHQMSTAPAVTDASFEQDVLKSEVPVLVDFWAPWCGPCRMVAPIVDEIAKEFEGQIKVFKLNTDENPNVASQYGIRSIPTLMLFKGGQKVETVVGAVPKPTLSGTISKHV